MNVASLKSLIYLISPAGSVQRFHENSRESHGSNAVVNVLILKFYASLHGELLCCRATRFTCIKQTFVLLNGEVLRFKL